MSRLLGADGQPGHVFQSGDAMRGSAEGPRAISRRRISCSASGCSTPTAFAATAPTRTSRSSNRRRSAARARSDFRIERLDLVEGTYKIDVAAHKLDGYPYDYHRLLYTFRVKSRTKDVGIYRPEHRWQFSPNIRFKAGRRRERVTPWTHDALACRSVALGRRGCERSGRAIVFTNGVFDLLHPGHVRYLQDARSSATS